MAIHKIENITINGAEMAFNGYPYSVDYEIGFGRQPSQLTLHFVSEDGTYEEPTLSCVTPYEIKIGDLINQNFYAISSEFVEDTGKTLQVTFKDGSVLLDRIWVGLHKRHGENPRARSRQHLTKLPNFAPSPYPDPQFYASRASSNSMIIVGEEIHPCDIDEDGIFSDKDLALLVYDATDPCKIKCNSEGTDINSIHVSCINSTRHDIFKVNYSFSELLSAIREKGVQVDLPSTIDVRPHYRKEHIGTLRQVLLAWCDSLGMNFYWESDFIHFVDIKTRPVISIPNFPKIEKRTTTRSLEGTVQRGSITYYEHKGETVNKDCRDAQLVALHCLNLRDLYGDYWKPNYQDGDTGQVNTTADTPDQVTPGGTIALYKDDVYPNGVPIEKLEEACICSMYDPRLRWLYILRNYYGLNKVSDFVAKEGKILDRFGGMKILKVISADSPDADTARLAVFQDDQQLTKKQAYHKIASDAATFSKAEKERKRFEDNKGFFVLVKIDSRRLESQYHVEQSLANNFIGKYWIRSFVAPTYGHSPEIKPNGQFVAGGTSELKTALFANFQHSKNSRVGQLAKKLQIKDKPDPKLSQHAQRKKVEHNQNTVIMYERPQPVWSPPQDPTDYVKTIMDKMEPLLPHKCEGVSKQVLKRLLSDPIDMSDGTFHYIYDEGVTADDIDEGRIIMLAFFPGTFEVTNRLSYNLFEENPMYAPTEQYPNAKLGMNSKRNYKYNIWGMEVDMPAGSSVYFTKTDNTNLLSSYNIATTPRATYDISKAVNPSQPIYTVAVIQTSKPFVEIPKIQVSLISHPSSTDAAEIDYHVLSNPSEAGIRALNKVSNKKCELDMETLKTYHQKFNKNMTYSVAGPLKTVQLSIYGITLPENTTLSIGTGLEALSIQLTNKGVKSTFRFGDANWKNPLDKDYLNAKVQDLEFQLARRDASSSIFGTHDIPIPLNV